MEMGLFLKQTVDASFSLRVSFDREKPQGRTKENPEAETGEDLMGCSDWKNLQPTAGSNAKND